MKKRLHQYAFHVGRVTLHVSRWTLFVSSALLVLLTIAFVIAGYLLPLIAEQKPELEAYLSERSGHQVRIESLEAHWDGLYPGARAQGVQVFVADRTQPAVRLSEVRISLSLLPLMWGDFVINNLVLVNPSLALERLQDGRFRVSGFDPVDNVERGRGEQFVSWLFQQGRLEIENGEFQWFDHRDASKALHLTRVNLSLRNRGDRHRLEFGAEFPSGMCDGCSLMLDIEGNPLVSQKWDGDIDVRAGRLDLKALPLIAREKLPEHLLGKFALQLRSEWEQGRPVLIRGQAHVLDLSLPVRARRAPLAIREASGDVHWRGRPTGWRLDVANPRLALNGAPWEAGYLRLVYRPERSEFRVRHVNLGDLSGFVAQLKKTDVVNDPAAPQHSQEWLDAWLAVKPKGSVDNLSVTLSGDWDAPKDFELGADLTGVAVHAHKKLPGVQGVSGRLSMTRETGTFRLDSNGMKLTLPEIFRQPLDARRASGELRWEKTEAHWSIAGKDLRVNGADGNGTGKLSLRIPHDRAQSPVLKLNVEFQDGNGKNAARYYPAAHLPPKTLAWMERSFLGGEITKGYFIYDGPIRAFPFKRGEGKFELRGHVRRATYAFLPGWEPIRQAEVDVAIDGTAVTVTGYGKIGRLDATQVVVHARHAAPDDYVVHVGGKVGGALDETLKVLREVKPEAGGARWLSYLPADLQAIGSGILSLDLTIPVDDERSHEFQGEYRFMKNDLRFARAPLTVGALEGRVRFTQAGLREGELRGQVLGGETVLEASQREGKLQVFARGDLNASALAPFVGPKLAARINGSVSWTGLWRGGRDRPELAAEADLSRLKLTLPAPLDRPEGWANERLSVRTEPSRDDNLLLLSMQFSNHVNGKLAWRRHDAVWTFGGARIHFGGTPAGIPKTRELQVRADVDELDVDQWTPLLGGGAGGQLPAWFTRVSGTIAKLNMFDREFGYIAYDFSRHRDDWLGSITGGAVSGSARVSGKATTRRIELELSHLYLPDKKSEPSQAPGDPRRLPAVVLRSKVLEARGKFLGELDFEAVPRATGWRVERLVLSRPDMNVSVNGDWRFDGQKHESEFRVDFNSPDMGKTMAAFGAPDQLAGGEVAIQSRLSWLGSPTTPRLKALNGRVEVNAKRGRFLQVKSGAGRLFGLLDLSAIGRYLLLDFSPVFGKGFIYDEIKGEVHIDKGDAYTEGFAIHGPATELKVGGRIGLVAEDYDLAIEVQPKISDSVTIAAWGVLGPQVAAAVLAVQKIFKKQIAAGTRITYVVKGPWKEPKITKLVKAEREKPNADEEQQ